ncbi:Oligopeptide transporter OPT superfamily [Penicillium bovifimosum]|uniref:non-specific serine/threonine protein kinase n=1 Tax=Penicillium bovifimosum TaxID=126998 RepID=A0A9W9H1G8_9EURO|nr:Oligopeptide transporter OPT superfamily [Penicillium bovifimosum]KAJ5135673.1 Oligopeptide transporter OPT superfamily [Penicillium bovifimosum]
MSAPTTKPPTVVRSHSTSSRPSRGPSDLPHRTRSVAIRPSNPSQPPTPTHLSHSKTPSQDRRPPSNHSALDSIARRDAEASNIARMPSRREASADRSQERPSTARTETTRRHQRNPSAQSRQRDSVDVAPTLTAHESSQHATGTNTPTATAAPRRRTTITTPTGHWALGKTIGAGSMGKVKLAKNLSSGEQVAVKIIPRYSSEEHRTTRETERADRSKEIRTAREAAIVSLVSHPYICGMRDVVRTTYHWYMLFEYVNGGQMLDYIISHGKLKEKQARKFARQIASALDYCHRNSIVHRDLKIENILISKTGDIKIIDFGLSNLFSPRSLLKTFCGSLYFAAPELLQARQYTGPEVDVWSFGIVLYVLVCGKVPFDDQSMPQLHAKIKKGVVEYPPGLTAECRHIISRMLVTDPKQRASLAEIMNHPWMNKGFGAPPENYLPHREPLQLPLDQEVIEKMTGFDFGPPDYITAQLTKVLESDDYQHAVRLNLREQQQPVANHAERKRGVFDFYKRRNSAASRDTLSAPSAEAVQLGNDPLNAYSPLISTYHLVKEKLDRERSEACPGALGLHQTASEVQVPDLRPPEAAHTNQYQLAGDKDTGRRSRPRARTHGEDEAPEGFKTDHTSSPATHAVPTPQPDTPAKKESTAAGLLRRFSTRRTKDRSRDVDRERISTPNTPVLNVQAPADSASPMHRGFSVRRTRRAEPSPGGVSSNDGRPQQDLLTAPGATEHSARTNKFLERSASVNSAEYRSRRSARRPDADSLEVSADRQPPSTSDSDQVGSHIQKDSTSARPSGRTHTARTMSLGHARRESIQARRARRDATREANVPEETDADISGAGTALESANEGEDLSKPVYLKGLFSVSTTSSKALPVIRADIIRVLRQLAVEYVEIKGGFSCRHAPSIDLDKVVDVAPPSPERQGQVSTHRRRISFGGLLSHDDGRDDSRTGPSKLRRAHAAPDRSFTTNSDGSEEYVARDNGAIGERVVGETTTRVQSDTGENLVLRFEILIVKVPLFSLHGIQFKKVSGGMWQYREMAKKILDALRL